MSYTKSLCLDKLDLIQGMIVYNQLNHSEIEYIWWKLNDVSHDIDEYLDKHKVRERKQV